MTLLIGACKKQTLITDSAAKLGFSTDTLAFDTVFSTIGSATRLFKVFNRNKQPISISKIQLSGGASSQFRMNVDGLPGTLFESIEIAAEDSLYVFVEVTIDPGNVNNPFLILDSVVFLTNGNIQNVKLSAYGQNAHFYNNIEICNEVWNDDKPHVILGSILVDTNCTLTLTEGVRVFVHANANIFVSGTLKIQGTADSVVTFEGDRLEGFFDDLPGQWGNIVILRGSTGSSIEHAHINEATSGIVIGSTTSNNLADFNSSNLPDVTIRKTEIKNCLEYGIFSFYSDVIAENSLIYSCGKNNVALLFGGNHTLTHCTLANYGTIGLDHKLPVLKISNYAVQNQVNIHLRDGNSDIRNSIVYGNIPIDTSKNAGEVEIDTVSGASVFDFEFNHCLLKTNRDVNNGDYINVITNADPQFEMVDEDNYRLKDPSPALNTGNPTYILPEDIFGQIRGGQADLGAIKAD